MAPAELLGGIQIAGLEHTGRPVLHTQTVSVETPTSDQAQISDEAYALLDGESTITDDEATNGTDEADDSRPADEQDINGEDLSPEEVQTLRQLQARDKEVRTHERAHQTVGGQYAGNASYTYQYGPDQRRYAVGGEVPIDVGKEKEPQQTIEKMRVVKRAALAPAEPSAADRRIAATANVREVEASRELVEERLAAKQAEREEEANGSDEKQAARLADDNDRFRAATPSERQRAAVSSGIDTTV